MYYCGFTYRETYALPVAYKRWFMERLVREMTRGQEDGGSGTSRGAHHNTPEARALQGMSRAEGPSRLRRFT